MTLTVTKECERLGLTARPVDERADVERLRLIRNACRAGFAHDNEPISEAAQRAWWVANKGRVRAWLYTRYSADPRNTGVIPETVGYGLLRQTGDDRWWTSIGVLPAYSGNGYGGAIMADVVRRSVSEVFSSARLDNEPAQRLHRKADWDEVDRDDRLVHFKTLPHVSDDAVLT